MQSFVKMKSSRNGEITLPFTDEGKICHSREFLRLKYAFKAIHENKILAEISEFTVLCDTYSGLLIWACIVSVVLPNNLACIQNEHIIRVKALW